MLLSVNCTVHSTSSKNNETFSLEQALEELLEQEDAVSGGESEKSVTVGR